MSSTSKNVFVPAAARCFSAGWCPATSSSARIFGEQTGVVRTAPMSLSRVMRLGDQSNLNRSFFRTFSHMRPRNLSRFSPSCFSIIPQFQHQLSSHLHSSSQTFRFFSSVTRSSRPDAHNNNITTKGYVLCIYWFAASAAILGLCFLTVPLYRIYCQATG